MPGGAFYIFAPTGDQNTEFRHALEDINLPLRQSLVWVKNRFVLGHSDYHNRHEAILYGWAPGASRYFASRDQASVFDESDPSTMSREQLVDLIHAYRETIPDDVVYHDRPNANRSHPTMKPTGLITRLLRNSTLRGESVGDNFAGSGSTMIAAEQMGRRAYLVELDPGYCDVILERYAAFTGDEPERIG